MILATFSENLENVDSNILTQDRPRYLAKSDKGSTCIRRKALYLMLQMWSQAPKPTKERMYVESRASFLGSPVSLRLVKLEVVLSVLHNREILSPSVLFDGRSYATLFPSSDYSLKKDQLS